MDFRLHFCIYKRQVIVFTLCNRFSMEPVTPSKVKAKVTQSCLTPCNPMDYTVHTLLQARILECVAFPFSRELSEPRD